MSEQITTKTYAMAFALVACIILALAICGGAWGQSDLEMFKQTSEPIKL